MNAVKKLVLVFSAIAIVLSVAPLFATDPFQPDPNGGGSGSGSATWKVTCLYNGQEILLSKTCKSGGQQTCNCP